MKKGFTMIELIFVIVILGILAAVAIPRLAATRDDAEVSKIVTNIKVAIQDIAAYHISQGIFGNISDMTSVDNPIAFRDNACFEILGFDNNKSEINIRVGQNGLCKRVWETPGLNNLINNMSNNGEIKFKITSKN